MTDWTKLDTDYADTEIEEYAGLPDGAYEAVITEAAVEETSWGATQLTLVFQADYPYGNETRTGKVTKWLTIDSEQMADEERRKMLVGMLKRDLQTLGYDGKPSGLENRAGEFVGAKVEITVKTKQGQERTFKNVYVNRLVEKAPPRDPAAVAATQDDDDIPF